MTTEFDDIQPDMGADVEVESHEDANDSMYDAIASRMFDEPDNSDDVVSEQAVKAPVESEPQIKAPEHWANEHKAEFSTLTPEAKKLVLEREKLLERMANEKFEKVAAKQKELDAWSALMSRIQSEPAFAQHVFGYDKVRQQQETPKPPDDPIERLKWEAKREAVQEFAPMLDNVRQEIAVNNHVRELNHVKATVQRDPMFTDVQQGIADYISGLPAEIGREVYMKLDSSPREYMQMYGKVRTVLAGRKTAQGTHQNAQANQSMNPQPQQRITRTPVLEDAGAAPVQQANDKEKIKNALFKKIKRGAASSDELGDFFDASGVFDKMFK